MYPVDRLPVYNPPRQRRPRTRLPQYNPVATADPRALNPPVDESGLVGDMPPLAAL